MMSSMMKEREREGNDITQQRGNTREKEQAGRGGVECSKMSREQSFVVIVVVRP